MNTLFTLIQSISIIIASAVTVWGINSWRREAKWKRKYELAEEVLSAFYEGREKIQLIRNPFTGVSEGKSRKRKENETSQESEILDSAYVFIERYELHKEPFIRLSSLKFRFMTLYGKNSEQPFIEIQRIVTEIFVAANRLGNRYWKDQGRRFADEKKFESHLKQMHDAERIIWADYDQEDKIAARVDNCISKIEEYCAHIIQS
jgi:hypothetical protein